MTEPLPLTDWTVHKFGGTSVADAARYKAAADIVIDDGEQQIVVVSAMAGITDGLIDLTQRARTRDASYRIRLEDLCKRVIDVIEELFDGEVGEELAAILAADEQDLADVLRAIWLGRSCPEATLELVSGYGELWSARMLATLLATRGVDADWIDARQVLTVEHGDAGPLVDWANSRRRLDHLREERPAKFYVVTGFVASTPDGVPTTLKRNGSDFSASIFGSLIDARRITIWTDVDGVLSADPRRVPEAVVLDGLSYSEAMELAYFGASVLHPNTMAPAIDRDIPVWIRNARHPEVPGTRIGSPREPEGAAAIRVVQGLSTVDGITLVNVEGTGMIGVPGVARRLFGALEKVGRVGDADLAGELRALDLLRGARRAGRASGRDGAA